ncbi:e3 ubiquitin-protein ligase ring1-like isoform x3 [Plasmopara halstedii]|uniref:RING-type E3 ubiquitin transferase n=1 Tax=Plasmopara halstedii TaxID=4781 RepID=A0A0P1A7Z8_PLAHL|nr:e3 ubiquitin-protein ligase ring1-like isoform x3 [Plasmopara halstedii]CEG36801.1 e3 ubiquitin-protein ligase ring1-like isoform x3 [Plasmopara halstedii]|eukprot:XP_024573170.1 e3 ubiquitin-protein ligase ring1-like isoform x3 [Plasmopara halstedii]
MSHAELEPPRFWCHECSVAMNARVDSISEEFCCVQCGGNFVEEIEEDDPPQEFQIERREESQIETQSPEASAENLRAEVRNEMEDTRPSSRQPTAVSGAFAATDNGRDGPPTLPNLLQLISGAAGRNTRFLSSNGNPVEVYVSDMEDGRDPMSILDALGGMFPMLASNPGDYAFGNMANVISQLMQNDSNRHGAPPASKEVVEKLQKVQITQLDVDGCAECPVCKDFFAVNEEHNSCPLCRFELPTDDPDYERRRAASST